MHHLVIALKQTEYFFDLTGTYLRNHFPQSLIETNLKKKVTKEIEICCKKKRELSRLV